MTYNSWFPSSAATRPPSFYSTTKRSNSGRFPLREEAERSLQYLEYCPIHVTSTSNISSLLCSLIGFVNNSALDMMFDPLSKYFSFVKSLPMVFQFMLRTGLAKELLFALLTINLNDVSMMTTIQLRSSLQHAPFPDLTKVTEAKRFWPPQLPSPLKDIQVRALPIALNDPVTMFLESQRFMKFSTAAYGTYEIHAANAAHRLPSPAMMAGRTNPKEVMAKYLGIEVEDILYMSRPGDEHSVIPHFVAVDKHSKSLVLAIRGTNSCTSIVTDTEASTGK